MGNNQEQSKKLESFHSESQKTRESFAKILKEFKEIKASPGESEEEGEMEEMVSSLRKSFYNLAEAVSDRLYRMEESMYDLHYEHLKGHLPSIQGAGNMKKAIDKLGMSEDYEVAKKTIYASDYSRGPAVTIG